MIANFCRLYHTLKYLRPTQLFFFILRRKFRPKPVRFTGMVSLNPSFQLQPPLNSADPYQQPFGFFFLNQFKQFFCDQMDWRPSDMQRLWCYNLHYFNFLRDEHRDQQEKKCLLQDWIKKNPQGTEPGWEPFTISLRMVNWIFFLHNYPHFQDKNSLSSLYTQALWLEKNDERHILANHYFENLKALLFAGVFFSGNDARRWRQKGVNGIGKQLIEQNLADGGHFEKTPQYHGLMLQNYLDLYNLVCSNLDRFDPNIIKKIRHYCKKSLTFYRTIVFPDQTIPLFNDSAFGVSPLLNDLNIYFKRLSKGPPPVNQRAAALIALIPSGLFGYRRETDMFIITAADIGPRYQPGHTHCHMLSYELMLSGQRVVVDSGVCEYAPGAMRQYVRSTQAHNTVAVDGAQQSEVWAEFRMARRAKILQARIEKQNGHVRFYGGYKGFHSVKGDIRHYREVRLELDPDARIQTLHITDTIYGHGTHKLENFIHLHPHFRLTDQGNGQLALSGSNGLRLRLRLHGGVSYRLKTSYYCPEFGKKMLNPCIVMQRKNPLPFQLSYSLGKIQSQ